MLDISSYLLLKFGLNSLFEVNTKTIFTNSHLVNIYKNTWSIIKGFLISLILKLPVKFIW